MRESITIQSHKGPYEVTFTENIERIIESKSAKGGFIVCDSNIWELHHVCWEKIVDRNKITLVDATEENKSLEGVTKVIRTLLSKEFRRDNTILAIGGGVIQDIASFAASIIFRGVDWIYVPTTLLSQADSCIGSKTSINLENIKNVIGNFYPPKQIYTDLNFLTSLSKDDIRSGIGEMYHYFFYDNNPLIYELTEEYNDLLTSRTGLYPYLRESLMIKRSIIEIDEFDQSSRRKFNYGHTFGHAIETMSNFQVKHGLAVTMGMDVANYISMKMGVLEAKGYAHMKKILSTNMPEYRLAEHDVDRYLTILAKDKKNQGSQLRCILCRGLGELFIENVDIDKKLREILKEYSRQNLQ
jgi:3-dehydroquinate synthase